MVDADDQISLDDDSDIDEDLNVGDLDNVLDQMSAIKKFLRYSRFRMKNMYLRGCLKTLIFIYSIFFAFKI